ncbi:pyridoxine synthesis protein PDX2 [Polychaeton citri CBS 116435]|uniref:glutaminase n=1 Tax=Polychaeton citri CBS 116435 TaxID=1314669 RepID=A0A9P4Q636_9PEZI|nr:pyridoxine synthesis protein PDX2 [Polychaeton citri CBS 116435]
MAIQDDHVNGATAKTVTIGVLALQGAFVEHVTLLQQAASELLQQQQHPISIIQVRNPTDLLRCQGLILPGGESTSISLIAERTGLLEPLRDFVKIQRRPVWGTCAGLILLAESANKSKASGQELIGGLDVRVQRNYFGRQVESFEAALDLPFLSEHLPEAGRASAPFHSVFIRAPVVEKVLPSASGAQEQEASDDSIIAPARKATKAPVEILARLPGRAKALKDRTTTASELGEDGDIVAVRQGNVFGTAFHPELTGDSRIHAWWTKNVFMCAERN